MPLARVVRVPSIVGYVPPAGFRIVSVRKLEDGSYEVTLEPLELPRWPQDGGGLQPVPILR